MKMKTPFFIALLALTSLTLCVSGQPTPESNGVGSASLAIPQGEIKVRYGEKTVYLIGYNTDDGASPSYWLGSIFSVEFMGIKAANNKAITIDGRSYPVRFRSSAPKVIEFEKANVNKLGGVFNISSAGKSTIVIAVQKQRVTIPMQVIKLPLRADMLPSAVIKALGKPDHRVASPDEGKSLHTINGKRVEISFESWKYKKYPGLRLIMDPLSGLNGWRMKAWDEVEKKHFR